MKKKIAASLLFSILLFSCTSTPDQAVSEEETSVSIPVENAQGIPEIHRMDDLPSWVFDSSPLQGKPRFVTFTTRRADRQEEQEKCLQLAAMEAAKFRGFFISAKELSQKGNTNFGYANEIFIDYQEELAPQYMDDLELDSIIQTPEGTFARFIFNGATSNVDFQEDYSQDPTWLNRLPELPGYLVILGAAERHRNWAESFKAADESAYAQMAYTLYGQVDNQVESLQRGTETRTQSGTLGTILIQGEGTIRNALVLGRWKDDLGLYYSLIAAPLSQ